MEATEYKCPACAATLKFSAESGDMACEYCDSHFTLEQLKQLAGNEEAVRAEDNTISWDEYKASDVDGVYSVITCPSCGAEIIADETTVATECIYCGNASIIRQKLTGVHKPDYVIPFKITKEQAINSIKSLYGGKKLLPDAFSEQNHIEKVAGVYVPYWLYDCESNAGMTFTADKVSHYSDLAFNYTKTDKYQLTRIGSAKFSMIPVDSSSKIDNSFTEAIEPYDYSELTKFNDSFLSGFLADRFDVDSETCNARADERVRSSMEKHFMSSVSGFSNVSVKTSNISNKNGKISYALMPVWLLNTRYESKMYTFAMNGQTGKIIGDLPCDNKKVAGMRARWILILGLIISAVIILLKLMLSGGHLMG